MTEDSATPFFDPRWTLEENKLGAGKVGRIEATPEECAEVAKLLELLECKQLVLTYNLKSMQPVGFRMRAEVSAEVVQACVVTTEPVTSTAREEVDVDLLPVDKAPRHTGPETLDVLEGSDSETYAEGRIDLGKYAFELLSTAIDPYPRKPGAEFVDPGEADRAKLSPFAVLGKLKNN
jgi:hypothetical protein